MNDSNDTALADRKSSRGNCRKVLGCGCLFLLVVIGAVSVYVAMNFKTWTSGAVTSGVDALVDKSELPEAQKAAIKQEVGQLMEDWKAGKVTWSELQLILEQVANSMIAYALVMKAGEAADRSAIPDDEKEAGRRDIKRLAHGCLEGTIDEDTMLEIIEPVIVVREMQFGDRREIVENEYPTDDEIRELLQRAKTAADEAGIPDDYAVDAAAWLQRTVQDVLAESRREE